MDASSNGRMDGCVESLDGCMGGFSGWVSEWIDGRMDEWVDLATFTTGDSTPALRVNMALLAA